MRLRERPGANMPGNLDRQVNQPDGENEAGHGEHATVNVHAPETARRAGKVRA